MSQIILIDGNPLLWRAYHSVGLTNDGVARGVLFAVSELAERFKSPLITFWDGGSRWRKQIYPKYKANRETAHKETDMHELFRQSDEAKKILSRFGIPQIQVKGIEADDLLSWFATYLRARSLQAVVCTNDKDLWQLAGDGIAIYNPVKKTLSDGSSFALPARSLPEFKALTGDASDNIAGVRGIGNKTALDLFEKYENLKGILDNQEDLSKSKRTSAIFDSWEQVETAYRLVKLSSYSEARWYITEEEKEELVRCLYSGSEKSPLNAQMIVDKYGPRSQALQNAPRLAEDVMRGIGAYMDKEPTGEVPTLSELDSAIKACCQCDLRGCCGDHSPTLPEGYSDVEIMVVGRNPGYEELLEGRPFVGKAGRRLDEFLEFVGLSRRDVWITNTCKCYSENNRPITYGEIMACSGFLRAEIGLIKPKLILTFGNEAMSMVTPYGSGVTSHCGEILENLHGLLLDMDIQAKVVVCVHPSAALRSKKNEAEMQYCAERVKELLGGSR